MKKLTIVVVVSIILVASLTACGGDGDKKSAVSAGDAASCVAIHGNDVQAWQFSALERMSNNVCWVYQEQVTR